MTKTRISICHLLAIAGAMAFAQAALAQDAGRGKAGDHGGARRFCVSEEFGVDRVHGGEILAVAEKDAAPDDVGHGSTAAFEQVFNVVEHLTRFGCDVAGNQLLGGRIDRYLPGDEDEIAGADRRGVGASRRGDAGRKDALDHELVSFRF